MDKKCWNCDMPDTIHSFEAGSTFLINCNSEEAEKCRKELIANRIGPTGPTGRKEECEMDKSIRWIPELGETYWYVTDVGCVRSGVYLGEWYDNWRISQDNCYRTERSGEEYLRILTLRSLWKSRARKSWAEGDEGWQKWYVLYDEEAEKLVVDWTPKDLSTECTYFRSEEAAKKAVEWLGEEDMLRYIL